MFKVFRIVLLWFIVLQVGMAGENFIVLDSGDNKEEIEGKKSIYEESIQQDRTIQELFNKSELPVEVKQFDDSYILKVGPFDSSDLLALIYFKSKISFPNAFILEEKLYSSQSPVIRTVEKKVYVEKEGGGSNANHAVWIAMFSLAFLGIFFMFLSSEQMKRMRLEHEKIKLKHDELELKQNEALSSMGENIQIIAKETMNHTHHLAQKVKETPFYEDVARVMHNENELLDVTGDLLKFLRLKSKKVVIHHEVCNFNHVLNEVAGLLNTKYKHNDIELVFDIDKDVPKNMLTDSVHLGQILINLLEYFIQKSHNKEVKIEVTTSGDDRQWHNLKFNINADVNIEDKERLFNSYYDEESRRYIGLGLFVAKELTYLMGGELEIKDRSYDSTMLIFTIPIEEKNSEKRKYRLPNKDLVGKKILIVDRSHSSALATQKLFAYFKAEIDVISAKTFSEQIPDFKSYEIVALGNMLFNTKVFEALAKVKEKQALKIISLENLFTSEETPLHPHVDIRLKKPLTQEYVFDTLVELYTIKEDTVKRSGEDEHIAMQVYTEAFKETADITLESFYSLGDAHILIVEDDIVNQNIFLEILAKSNIRVWVTSNGEEAIDFLHKTQEDIDMIFMDINMPVMDGYTAGKIIREDSRFHDLVIIFLSALASEHEVEKMRESGMNGYLPKPIQIGQLYTALKIFLHKENPLISPMVVSNNRPMVFEGLNVEDGIKNLHGNIALYKQVLQEFIDAYAKSGNIFESLVKEQRYGQIKVLCLEMKGLTGTIGAKEMHVIINEIHQHFIYKKPELLHSYVERYHVELDQLTESINLYLSL
ncbi:MAG: response regulator [Campylobacterota bacterium]|nr:response regulator [Campylobacterota bacterium]